MLRTGDVIVLKVGMRVYADIPEKFMIGNRPTSDKLFHTVVVIGKPYINTTEISANIREVALNIMESFSQQGFKISKDKAIRFVRDNVKLPTSETFCLPYGEYIVTDTREDGGSSGRDSYPDGHHVFCTKVGNNSLDVDFYETGCFTAMIEGLKPVRTMKKKVLWE